MEIQFYILLSQKTFRVFEDYGQYMLGDDSATAHRIFELLLGNQDYRNEALLHFDFMETVNDIPVRISTICCTLEEYACN